MTAIATYSPGELVRARGREWIVLSAGDALHLRPLTGSEEDAETIIPALEQEPIGYAAFAKHCGVYSHSGTVAPLLGPDYPAWKASKSGFLFTPDHPLPDDLVHRMIALRLAEIPAYG